MGVIILSAVLMLVLLFGGVWVAVSLGTAGSFGLYQILGFDRLISLIGKVAWQQSTSFVLIALPMFIFMGEVLFHSGIMNRIYSSASKVVSRFPGGLLQTNIAASTMFAACSGSSLASAATIGSVGYPLISSRGYNKRLALGSIAAGGTLGILIPPSIIFILYGGLAEISIGRLFLAGIVPGIVLAALYSAYIVVRALLDPAVAPQEPKYSLKEMVIAVGELWQVGVLAFVVLGGIYGGVATPTEVAALAATLTIIFAGLERTLSMDLIIKSALNTVRQTSMIIFIIIMAKLLALTLIYRQFPDMMVTWIEAAGYSPMLVIVALLLFYILMGMFFDGLSMMVITIPFVVPIMMALEVDLIWLGVLTCLTIEIGLLTPPVGLNLYVMQGATKEPLKEIVWGSLPFVGLQAAVLLLVLLVPKIAMYIPDSLF
ncbi:MAG: TRAP transporter large permease [Alphaproteobacteria bacterium]